jgi:hypothetical protein
MKLEDLIEFWNMLLSASVEYITVSRDIAEKTKAALARLDNVRDTVADLSEMVEGDLE